jgi:lipopolysaccharide biosynthesis protein
MRRPYLRADERAIGYVAYSKASEPASAQVRLVAFYLPQFHPIPENDAWWGKGFTEWRNVVRALPQFEGHAQPHLPGDLGFYDLRDPEVMREQARLAREYGIGAFCFYFYWFGGKTLLETPLRNWLADSSLDLPFCLCWANEKWSRRWDGRGDDILIDQQHSAEDDLAFIAYVADYLRDARCLRVHGKPVLLLYRPGLLPDCVGTAARWRQWCRDNGIGEIHLAYVQGFERPDPKSIGFDAAVEFPPNLASPQPLTDKLRLINPEYAGQALDWRTLRGNLRQRPSYRCYPGVSPGWDNEPRRPGAGRSYLYASPRSYTDWLKDAIDRTRGDSSDSSDQLVFINAWNEWAEGAVLEPDARLGYAYLQATRNALIEKRPTNDKPHVIIHAWYMDELDEILRSLQAAALPWRLVVTTSEEKREEVSRRLARSDMPWEIVVCGNRGRDLLPFIKVADRLLDEGVEVVLKLHTKRSSHRADGAQWLRQLLERLVEDSRANSILEAFKERPNLGMVGPEGHMLSVGQHSGANADALDYLVGRTGLPKLRHSDKFVAGSMFWIRLRALRPLLDAHLADSEFDIEAGQIDGTLAHAVERVIGACVETSGFELISAAHVCGQLEPPATPYRFAD